MHPNTSHPSTSRPRPRLRLAAASIVTAAVLAACGSSDADDASGAGSAAEATLATAAAIAEPATTEAMVDDMTDDSMTDDMADDSMVDDSMVDDMTDDVVLPAWQTMTFTDVDGGAFTLADFLGKPVFVETFATWCPNCREQLQATNAAAQQLGDQAVFIALSVETGLSNAEVAEYAADNGFDAVRFAVMSPEALAAVVDGLGQSAANPPSTPKVVIDAMGAAGELTTGFESADDIVAQVSGQG
jgi:thiol-disulfide isomerase/thioredoxin